MEAIIAFQSQFDDSENEFEASLYEKMLQIKLLNKLDTLLGNLYAQSQIRKECADCYVALAAGIQDDGSSLSIFPEEIIAIVAQNLFQIKEKTKPYWL